MINSEADLLRPESNGVSARVIVGALRRRIVSGDWVTGDRLPTRSEIEVEFGASRVTVQRALDELRRDGWVAVKGRQGTYVAPELPHLTRYALIFPHTKLPNTAENSFWSALTAGASAISDESSFTVSTYFGVDGHEDSEDYQRLVREVRADRLAGLIFASNPAALRGTPLLDEPDIPRVAIMSGSPNPLVPFANLDGASFWNRALDFMAARGRKRVAYLCPPHPKLLDEVNMMDLASRGLYTRPYWLLAASQGAPIVARNTMHLLMHERREERPDALIIADDNLVESAVNGILDSGSRIPADIEIVGHCNFPVPTPSPVPITRLGYDVRQLLRACLHSLEQQRRGLIPHSPPTPALFDHEVIG